MKNKILTFKSDEFCWDAPSFKETYLAFTKQMPKKEGLTIKDSGACHPGGLEAPDCTLGGLNFCPNEDHIHEENADKCFEWQKEGEK